nr:uncharacterized protein LOC109432819 [Aedes albopictus]
MDFIDNLLNHMSSKFNQESALPKQAEISMDETFKWRALKNNQFASRSKNGRSKVKTKDKDKHQTPNSSELSPSSDENNKSDSSPDPLAAEVSESTEIEIEIANDISGEEIQEALASTQGTISVLVEETNNHIEEECFEEGDKIMSLTTNEVDICETDTCTLNIAIENDENSATMIHIEHDKEPVQEDIYHAEKQVEESIIARVECELIPTTTTPQLLPESSNIFIHMSSTFNATCLTLDSAIDKINNSQSVELQNLSTVEPDVPSMDDRETSENKDMTDEVEKDYSDTSAGSVRRSKRLKPDEMKDLELKDMENIAVSQTLTSETLPSTSAEPVKETSNETPNDENVSKQIERTDNIVRTLRNKSIEVTPNHISKHSVKKRNNYEIKAKKNRPTHETNVDDRTRTISSAVSTLTRSKSTVQNKPKHKKPPEPRSNYPTRQRSRDVDIKTNRRRSSRFGSNTKKPANDLDKRSEDQKTKHSHESQRETAKSKTLKDHSPKQRTARLSRDGSDGILASAIARREKSDSSGIQGRLSRPIKLSAKILANDELRYGFELQNSARLNLNAEVKDSSDAAVILKLDPPVTVPEKIDSILGKPETNQESTTVCKPDAIIVNQTPISPTRNVQKKCRDPLDFLDEVKRESFGSNQSPECNYKLNKVQQRKLLKLKEKHMLMLGLQRTIKKAPATSSLSEKPSEPIPKATNDNSEKEAFTSPAMTLSDQSFILIDSPPREDQAQVQTEQPACRAPPSPPVQLPNKLVCLCQNNSRYFTTKTLSRMYCTAVDDIDGQFIGCNNELIGSLQNLLRPSNSASYQLLCTLHQRRLHNHGCCATCGIFCTQGSFVICTNKHLFHRDCAEKFIINTKEKSSPIIPKLVLKCPHCSLESIIQEYEIRLQRSPIVEIVTSRYLDTTVM